MSVWICGFLKQFSEFSVAPFRIHLVSFMDSAGVCLPLTSFRLAAPNLSR